MGTALTIFVAITLLVAIIVSLSRRNRAHKKVAGINEEIAMENEKFIALMNKIIEHKSFEILKDEAGFQVIKFDASVFNFKDVNWKKLSKKKKAWVMNFLAFLEDENSQHGLVKIKYGFLVLGIEPVNNELDLLFINQHKLNEYIDVAKKEFVCQCGHFNYEHRHQNCTRKCNCTNIIPRGHIIKRIVELKKRTSNRREWQIVGHYDSYQEVKLQLESFNYDKENSKVYKWVKISISAKQLKEALTLEFKAKTKEWVWHNKQDVSFNDIMPRSIICLFNNGQTKRWEASFSSYKNWKEVFELGPHETLEEIKAEIASDIETANNDTKAMQNLVKTVFYENYLNSHFFKFIDLKVSKKALESATTIRWKNDRYVLSNLKIDKK